MGGFGSGLTRQEGGPGERRWGQASEGGQAPAFSIFPHPLPTCWRHSVHDDDDSDV